MPKSLINYISLIYGIIFLAMLPVFIGKVRKTTSSSLRNIFWSFSAFSIMKAVSILSGLSIDFFPPDSMLPQDNIMVYMDFISPLAAISSLVSNVFLFHFGISILIYKTQIKIDYKIFSILLFLIFMVFHFTGIIDLYTTEKISRYSFGFNGAFLGSMGCFNLLKIKRTSGQESSPIGLIICGIALLFYSLTEGIITNPVLDIQVELLRTLSAIVLFISCFFIIDILKEERGNRIGFI